MLYSALCACVWSGDNPLISIRRSQWQANADFGHERQDNRDTKAAPIHLCGASTLSFKQTGSAYKDKGVTWIHWTLSQVLRFAIFINLSVFALRLFTAGHNQRRDVQCCRKKLLHLKYYNYFYWLSLKQLLSSFDSSFSALTLDLNYRLESF